MTVVNINELSSGCCKFKDSLDLVSSFRAGNIAVSLSKKKKSFKAVRNLKGTQLTKGILFSASYNRFNQGFGLYRFIGITDGSRVFDSVQECMKHHKVKSLKELDVLEIDTEGLRFYLSVEDLNTGDKGDWFYLNYGKWCRGSGAEPLSFIEVVEVK